MFLVIFLMYLQSREPTNRNGNLNLLGIYNKGSDHFFPYYNLLLFVISEHYTDYISEADYNSLS